MYVENREEDSNSQKSNLSLVSSLSRFQRNFIVFNLHTWCQIKTNVREAFSQYALWEREVNDLYYMSFI